VHIRQAHTFAMPSAGSGMTVGLRRALATAGTASACMYNSCASHLTSLYKLLGMKQPTSSCCADDPIADVTSHPFNAHDELQRKM